MVWELGCLGGSGKWRVGDRSLGGVAGSWELCLRLWRVNIVADIVGVEPWFCTFCCEARSSEIGGGVFD